MRISRDRFEEICDEEHPDGHRPGTNADRILQFLRDHHDQAFRPQEIADRLDIPEGSLGPTPGRLREQGRVDHREPYWALSDHERATDAAASHAGAVLAVREVAEDQPDVDEWQAHAVDPREHRREQ